MTNPKRGEIWLVQLDPTVGQELQKTRPAVVINSELFATIPMRIVVPLTSWQPRFQERPFMVSIKRTEDNGLAQDSAGNLLQLRSVSTERFTMRLGQVSQAVLQEILAGLVICVDYE
ncbi:type II toxin-antitoxin system PemK/MazF family toxin [Calothrix sp. 336/3]|uniref:type II toxin-antitoxin system PemK/MazF family toxin n=1 Tax=Calothrix sp. 336/3 TaxID=1337936 RepID=UPI0004E4066F|nr:type II toxin-antitoxin system PemK/MazF family toxin [Calothrix sp. 336/3]AKG23468.1 PemK family transcriptional regulator [Calothrix sp. 336/3]